MATYGLSTIISRLDDTGEHINIFSCLTYKCEKMQHNLCFFSLTPSNRALSGMSQAQLSATPESGSWRLCSEPAPTKSPITCGGLDKVNTCDLGKILSQFFFYVSLLRGEGKNSQEIIFCRDPDIFQITFTNAI